MDGFDGTVLDGHALPGVVSNVWLVAEAALSAYVNAIDVLVVVVTCLGTGSSACLEGLMLTIALSLRALTGGHALVVAFPDVSVLAEASLPTYIYAIDILVVVVTCLRTGSATGLEHLVLTLALGVNFGTFFGGDTLLGDIVSD